MEIPDNKTVDLQLYILDPLSVIIKLAILSNKPIGTKICISKNIIFLQEPGPFQAFCRYIFSTNKTDIQYLYNPIEIACKNYLVDIDEDANAILNQQFTNLFKCAQNGLLKLIETYKHCSVMRICLNYYVSLISNYLEEKNNETLFRKDDMTKFYTTEIIHKLSQIWTSDKISIVLNLTSFLTNDTSAEMNVKSLETIIDGIDKQVSKIL